MTPSIGWGVLHLFYRVDRGRADQDPGAAKRIVDAVASLEADGHQALTFVVLGHKADLGVMALRTGPRPAARVPAGAARRPAATRTTRTCR